MKRWIFVFALLISTFSFGQEPVNFDLSSCSERSYPEFIKSRVVKKELNDGVLTLRLGLVLNCCIEPEVALNYHLDTLYVTVDNVATTICMCECCFEIEMTATGVPNTDFQVIYREPTINVNSEDFETIYLEYPLEANSRKYVFPNPDELKEFEEYSGEINQLNEDSLKIGLWKKSTEQRNYLISYIINEKGQSKQDWYAAYDLEGKLESIHGKDGLGNGADADRYTYYRLFDIDETEKF